MPDEKQQQVVGFIRNKQQKEVESMMDDIIFENEEALLELAK